MSRRERKQQTAVVVRAYQAEFIRAWNEGGEPAAFRKLAEFKRDTPQQSHLFLRAFATVHHVGRKANPSARVA